MPMDAEGDVCALSPRRERSLCCAGWLGCVAGACIYCSPFRSILNQPDPRAANAPPKARAIHHSPVRLLHRMGVSLLELLASPSALAMAGGFMIGTYPIFVKTPVVVNAKVHPAAVSYTHLTLPTKA